MSRDWGEWHHSYDDPDSALSARLAAVVEMIRQHLDAAPSGTIRVLSLCSGDGRDLARAAHGHERAPDLSGLLVELDPELAERATENIAALDADLRVRCADAGDPAAFGDALPVDLLLLCGIFGNISERDIRRTVAAVPALCRPGATVIWTRHRREPDVTPRIRRWFDEAGCTSRAFVSPGVESFAVGSERFTGPSDSLDTPGALFTFRPDLV